MVYYLEVNKRRYFYERYRISWRFGNAPLPDNEGSEQATTPDLRQTDGLLPAFHTHAGGHSRYLAYLHTGGFAQFPGIAQGRVFVRRQHVLCGAALAGWAGPGVYHRRGIYPGL